MARARNKKTNTDQDKAFENLMGIMKEDTSKVWTSVEVFQKYVEVGGETLSR